MDTSDRETYNREICRQYRESGLTQKSFCEKHGIGRSTLGLWLQRERTAEDREPGRTLVRIGPMPSGASGRTLRFRVKDTLILELDLPASERDIQTVIRAVEGA